MNKKTKFKILFLTCLFLSSSCDIQRGLHPVKITGISGSVTFSGSWPQETEWVRVVTFSKKPRPDNFVEFIAFLKSLSDPVPMNAKSYEYVLQLDPGIYEWIVVAWQAKDQLITEVRMLGEYTGSDTGSVSQPVNVEADKLTKNIDIIADFNVLE